MSRHGGRLGRLICHRVRGRRRWRRRAGLLALLWGQAARAVTCNFLKTSLYSHPFYEKKRLDFWLCTCGVGCEWRRLLWFFFPFSSFQLANELYIFVGVVINPYYHIRLFLRWFVTFPFCILHYFLRTSAVVMANDLYSLHPKI